jgi:hypothetical protein
VFVKLLIFVLIMGGLLVWLTLRKASRQYQRGVRDSLWEGSDQSMDAETARRFIDDIPRQAEKHRELMKRSFGVELDYRKSDFARLDEVIDKGWGHSTPKRIDAVVSGFGCFFGETIRRLQGGTWDHDEVRGIVLRDVGGRAVIEPFEKVRQRFRNGDRDSLALFYIALSRKLGSGE